MIEIELHRGLTEGEALDLLNKTSHCGRFDDGVLLVQPMPTIRPLYGTAKMSVEDRINDRHSVRTLAEASAAIFHLSKR